MRKIFDQLDDSISGLYNDRTGTIIAAKAQSEKNQFKQMSLSAGPVLVASSDTYCHIDLSKEAAIAQKCTKKRKAVHYASITLVWIDKKQGRQSYQSNKISAKRL